MKMVLKYIAVAALALGIMTGTAMSHSKISESVPPDGGSVKSGIEKLKLGFSDPVRVMLVRLSRTDQPADIPIGKIAMSSFTTTLDVKVPPLGIGAYSVTWTAVAKDGHVMKGGLSFTVEP